MKFQQIILLLLLPLLTLSCSDDFADFGSGVRPTTDQILIGTDTFHLKTNTIQVDSTIFKTNTSNDSFLLGSYYDKKFGSVKAEILAQVGVCKEGFEFPANSVPDSAFLMIRFNSWFGDAYSPVELSAYEINKSTFSYSGQYFTNINPSKYTDESVLLGRKVFTAATAAKTKEDSIRLSDDFVKKFFNDDNFKTEASFLEFFKGIYLKTSYGSSLLMNVSNIAIQYHYHYTYKAPGTNTLTTVNDMQTFSANKEVRQVNRILHPDRNAIQFEEGVNYVSGPANYHTSVSIPLEKIKSKINQRPGFANKTQLLNNAILKIEAVDVKDSSLAVPPVRTMLLIKSKSIDRFFKKAELPSDTCAIVAQLTATKNATTGEYDYSYNYDLAPLIANELKNAEDKKTALEDLNMVLMPVSITYSQSSSTGSVSYSSIIPKLQMCGVAIRGGNNKERPMKINLVYSGF